jgi:predicted acyl esterase
LPDWPPPSAAATTFYLRGDRTIAESSAPEVVHTYIYDPADPTPAVGLSTLGGPETALPTDNRALEARPDVLTYTTPTFTAPATLAGAARARLFVTSTEPTADFFVASPTFTPTEPASTSPTASFGSPRPHRSKATLLCRPTSISARWRTGFPPGTPCACRSPAAPTRSTPAIRAEPTARHHH